MFDQKGTFPLILINEIKDRIGIEPSAPIYPEETRGGPPLKIKSSSQRVPAISKNKSAPIKDRSEVAMATG